MPSNHLVLCRPLLLLPSIFPNIRVFSNELALLIRWPKYWSFSCNISPSNEHPGLISFRMDWLDLLAVQGTLKSLLQHHSSQASNLLRSAFFIVQLSYPYMTTGKTIVLTRRPKRLELVHSHPGSPLPLTPGSGMTCPALLAGSEHLLTSDPFWLTASQPSADDRNVPPAATPWHCPEGSSPPSHSLKPSQGRGGTPGAEL